ncbi:serine/threonine-protein kinase [Litorilituus lipolyticus]|uniref:Serine/threonine protein kinase n=1 Tax=Litorilituus lipolyticus TaxID=2491017 RepID=A0A502KZV4_9GAMM|nr:serine/threonine-protein kinase [Litorilituus lipolyticus]TPH15745.1 serine/threonine protein kinase [Litorilituus lipolyticus]
MNSSNDAQRDLSIQKNFSDKAEKFSTLINNTTKKKKHDKSVLKNLYTDLCKSYDTYLRYQLKCIEFCDLLILLVTNEKAFIEKYKCNRYAKEALNQLAIKPQLSDFISLVEQFKNNVPTNIGNWSQQIRQLEHNKEAFKTAIKDNSFQHCPSLMELDLNILVLGFLRYKVNSLIILKEDDFRHTVNTEDNVEKVDKIETVLNPESWQGAIKKTSSLMNRLVGRVCCLNQVEFNLVDDQDKTESKLRFFARVKKCDEDVLAVVTNLSEMLSARYLYVEGNLASDDRVWEWFKKDVLISLMGINTPDIYKSLKQHSQETPFGYFDKDFALICTKLGLVYKAEDNDGDQLMITSLADKSYCGYLIKIAKGASTFNIYTQRLLKEIQSVFEINTKNNNQTNSQFWNEETRDSNVVLNLDESLKSFLAKAIEQVAGPLIERGEDAFSKTTILESYFGITRCKKSERSAYAHLYIKYIDQLFGRELSRYLGKPFPIKADLDMFLHEIYTPQIPNNEIATKIEAFFKRQNNLADCIIEINQSLNESNKNSVVKEILGDITAAYGIEHHLIFALIEKNIEQISLSNVNLFGSKEKITFKRLKAYSKSDNPLLEYASDANTLFKNNVLVRLFINVMLETQKTDASRLEQLIEVSTIEELECTHRAAVHNEFVAKLKVEKTKVLDTFEKFKCDQIYIAKIYVVFHLLNWEKDKSKEPVPKVIEQLAYSYLKQPNKPKTFDNFKKSPIKNISVKGELTSKFDKFPITEFIEVKNTTTEQSSSFQLANFAKQELINNEWDIEAIEQCLNSTGIVESVWVSLLNCTGDLKFMALISKFLDGAKPAKKKQDHKHYKNYVTTGSFVNNFLSSVANMEFSEWLFPHSQDQREILENKLIALGNIRYFGDEHFEIEQSLNAENKLGQGTFGCVYLAKDLALDAKVAIKLIPTWGDDPESHERITKKLLSEASIMRHCQHDNVAIVYGLHKFQTNKFSYIDASTHEQQAYLKEKFIYGIIIEYIDDARTLESFVQSQEFANYSYKEKINLFIQICKGVEQAHNLPTPMIHGDITPANILIDKNCIPKLIDFGIASQAGNYLGANSGKIYSSPNILSGGKADIKDDIHSLGMILLFLLYPAVIKELVQSTTSSHSERLKLFFHLLGFGANSACFTVDETDAHKNLKQQYNQVEHFSWGKFEELILNNILIPQSSFWDFDWSFLFATLSKSLNSVSLSCHFESNIANESNTYSQVASLIISLKRFLTSGGLADALNSVKLRTVAIYNGETLERENIANLPVFDIYGDIQRQVLPMKLFESLETICKVDNFKKDCLTFIAFEQNHNFSRPFIYHLPNSCFVGKNFTTNFIRDFYQPNKQLLEQLSRFDSSQFIEQFINLISTLPQEYTAMKEASYNPDLMSKAATFSLSSIKYSLLFDLIEQISGELLKCLHQESTAVKVIELINEANRNGLGELEYTTKIEILNNFESSSNSTKFLQADDEFESIFGWRGSFSQTELQLISEVLFSDSEFNKTLLINFLGLKPRLTNIGLLTFILKNVFPQNFIENAQISIRNLMNSEEYKLAKTDIALIEEYMHDKLTEHHLYLKCSDPYTSPVSYCNSYPEHKMPFIILSDVDSK